MLSPAEPSHSTEISSNDLIQKEIPGAGDVQMYT